MWPKLAGVIFRKKNEQPTEPELTPAVPLDKKGHATPTRKQSEQARKRPLVSGDPKTAKKRQRERQNELYALQRQAMETGDPKLEKYLATRDQGAARRFARDYVDARYSVGELFLPVAFLLLIVMMLGGKYPELALTLTGVMYFFVFAGLLDSLIMVWFLNRRLKAQFNDDAVPKWTGFYAFQRSFMLRRFRMPRPLVKRGQWPHKTAA